MDSFGHWVRRRRKALDLTQEELAQRVGCAAVTLRKIEADQRRPSCQMAQRLADCLLLPEQECPAFIAAAVGQYAPSRLPWPVELDVRQRAGNLPAPLTSLVGRTSDIAVISDCLGQPAVRMLTLTGPVGVGKTRLALEVGRRLAGAYRDGACLVALAPVRNPALVPSTTATALGVREARDSNLAQAVVRFLSTREMLLIFDNFEHLLPAASFLVELLASCSELQVLVTSRARLHLYGEHEFIVSPLLLPDRNNPLDVAGAEALQLFCDRARAARSDFQLTPSLTPVVADLCRRLDGLPLAIELAAAKLKLLSPQELSARMEHRLPVLRQDAGASSTRHQGLDDALAWSYGLLAPAERVILTRLAVFAGGFDLAAAEATCAFPLGQQSPDTDEQTAVARPDVIGGVFALLDQSLLVRGGGESAGCFTAIGCCGGCPLRELQEATQIQSRFSMLEIIREFALERLRTSGELALMQHRHAEYFAAWAAEAAAQLEGPDQAVWLARLEQNTDNLRAALVTLLATGPLTAAVSMACALGAFWQRHGHYSEGRRWLEQVLAQMAHPVAPESDKMRARALQIAASLASRQGDWQAASQWLAESMAIYRAIGDRPGLARVLSDLGWIALDQANWDEAARLNQESLDIARETGDLRAMYRALISLGWARFSVGAWDAAGALLEEAHDLAWRAEHTKGVAVAQAKLAWIALHQRDAARAADLARRSLHTCHLLGERTTLAECLEILAAAAAVDGDARRAFKLKDAAAVLWQEMDVSHLLTQRTAAHHSQAMTATRQAAENGSGETMRQGSSVSLDAVVAFALDCGGAPARSTSSPVLSSNRG